MVLREYRAYLHPLDVQRAMPAGRGEGLGKMDKRGERRDMKVITSVEPETFIKRAFYLAWQACGGPLGMGVLQDNPKAVEEDIWKNVNISGDYPTHHNKPNEYYGDYVFGRMMKWGCRVENGVISLRNEEFDRSYNSFAHKYKDTKSLLDATAESLGCEYESE
jgi:hypothetical protein